MHQQPAVIDLCAQPLRHTEARQYDQKSGGKQPRQNRARSDRCGRCRSKNEINPPNTATG